MIKHIKKLRYFFYRVAPERPSSSAISRTVEDINTVSSIRDHPPSYEMATRLEVETEF